MAPGGSPALASGSLTPATRGRSEKACLSVFVAGFEKDVPVALSGDHAPTAGSPLPGDGGQGAEGAGPRGAARVGLPPSRPSLRIFQNS